MKTEDVMGVIDHAAMMPDRWLFLAVLALLLAGCGTVIYWLVRQLQVVLAAHRAAREAHQAMLTQIIATQNDTPLKLAVCIDHNTTALNECTYELRRVNERRKA